MKVAPGIYKVEGMRVGNAYVVETGEHLTVVDSGIPGSEKHILRTIERLGRRPESVRTIVLTHWHPDHIGGAAELRRATGAAVAIHQLDAGILAGGERPAKGRRAMGFMIRLFRVRFLTPDLTLTEGDSIGGLEVIHVPGHTAGSIMLRREDGVVFTGDAMLGDRRGRVRPPDRGLSLDPDRAMVSLRKIEYYRPTLVLPGHGKPAKPAG